MKTDLAVVQERSQVHFYTVYVHYLQITRRCTGNAYLFQPAEWICLYIEIYLFLGKLK